MLMSGGLIETWDWFSTPSQASAGWPWVSYRFVRAILSEAVFSEFSQLYLPLLWGEEGKEMVCHSETQRLWSHSGMFQWQSEQDRPKKAQRGTTRHSSPPPRGGHPNSRWPLLRGVFPICSFRQSKQPRALSKKVQAFPGAWLSQTFPRKLTPRVPQATGQTWLFGWTLLKLPVWSYPEWKAGYQSKSSSPFVVFHRPCTLLTFGMLK